MGSQSLAGYRRGRRQPSAPGPRVSSKSTIAPATQNPTKAKDRKLVFISEWVFKPEGVRAVRVRFEEELARNNLIANHEWDDDAKLFRVRCVVGDTPKVSVIFHRILADIISESYGDDYCSDEEHDGEVMVVNSEGQDVPFRSDMIERLSVWRKRNGQSDPPIGIATTAETSQAQVEPPKFPAEIMSHNAKFIWKCEGTPYSLDELVPDETLRILKALTGCDFVKNLNERKVYIGHASEANCRDAVSRLDNIKKYSGTRRPYTKHIYYSEDIQNFEVIVCPSVNIPMRFFETILLNPCQMGPGNNYGNLDRTFTVRCAPWDGPKAQYLPLVPKDIRPAVDNSSASLKPGEYLDFEYHGRGNLENSPLRHFTNGENQQILDEQIRPVVVAETETAQDQLSRIQGWAQQIPPPTLSGSAEDMEQSIYGFNPSMASKNTTFRPAAVLRSSSIQDLDSERFKIASSITTTSRQAPRMNAHHQGQLSNSSSEYWSARSSQPEDDLSPLRKAPPMKAESKRYTPICLLDEDMPPMNFATLQPLRRGESSSTSSFPTRSCSMPHIASRQPAAVAKNPGSKLSRPQPGQELLPEKLQEITEASTRKYHATMNQKASKPGGQGEKQGQSAGRLELPDSLLTPKNTRFRANAKRPINDPVPEFHKHILDGFEKLTRGLRGFPGDVVVRVELGRIILRKFPSKLLSSEEDLKSYLPEELADLMLPRLDKPKPSRLTFFSNILTELPMEINYLVEMKNSAGHPMWERKPTERSIIYEISCHDERLAGWNPFSVEIEGDTFESRIKTRHDFGAINVHGTRRHWDFRIAAFGFGDGERNDNRYGIFARAIQRSLYIPPDLPEPSLLFELDDSFNEDSKLVIDNILVHHISKHESTKEAKSILTVSKTKLLNVDSRYPFAGAQFQVYKAEMPSENQKEAGDLNIWHEASISSTKANMQLKQNAKLKLGDEAEWTPERLLQLDTARAMYLPACEMLKQMDGVGFYNDNGINMLEESGETGEPQPQDEYYFW